MRLGGWAFIKYDQCPYKKRRLGHRREQREDHVGQREKTATDKPRRKSSEGTKPANTLISDFRPRKL